MNDCFWDCAQAHAALELGDPAKAAEILAAALAREVPANDSGKRGGVDV